jgi:hypothetical protein
MSEQRFTCLETVGPDRHGCGLTFGSWEELQEHRKTHTPRVSWDRKEHAVKLLTHYLSVAFNRSGAKWEHDNDMEVRELIDAIVEAAVGETIEAIGREGL